MKTEIKIKTWRCGCGYSQDFEPTQENMDLHFNHDRNFPLNGVEANQCPSCGLKRKNGKLKVEKDEDKKISVIVMGEDEVDDHKIEKDGVFRKLTASEKTAFKKKIREDIIKFKEMEG